MFNISLWQYLKKIFPTNFAYLDDGPKFHFGRLSPPHVEFHRFFNTVMGHRPFDSNYLALFTISGIFTKTT